MSKPNSWKVRGGGLYGLNLPIKFKMVIKPKYILSQCTPCLPFYLPEPSFNSALCPSAALLCPHFLALAPAGVNQSQWWGVSSEFCCLTIDIDSRAREQACPSFPLESDIIWEHSPKRRFGAALCNSIAEEQASVNLFFFFIFCFFKGGGGTHLQSRQCRQMPTYTSFSISWY